MDVAVLEDRGGVAKDEVNGPGDEAVGEELAVVVNVESVLVSEDVALVEGGEVGPDPESHGLVLRVAGGVLEGNVPGEEAFSDDGCKGGKV